MPIRNFPFLGSAGDTKRPWLPIKIVNPHTNQSMKIIGLVDTGADECTIPAEFAAMLGHTLQNGASKMSNTAGGPGKGWLHTTRIEIYNLQDQLIYTINDTPLDFMEGLHIPLLGVSHFLDNFQLHIDYPKKNFSITWPIK